MNKLIAIVGEDHDFIKDIEEEAKTLQAIQRTISVTEKLEEVVSEIVKRKKFPVTINEHEMRQFYSKMGKGVFSAQMMTGRVFNSEKDLVTFFGDVVGKKRWGENWILEDLKETLEDISPGVHLLTNLTTPQAIKLKTENPLLVALVQAVETENMTPEDLEKKKKPKVITEVLDQADVTIRITNTSDGIKRQTMHMLTKLKNKWKEESK